MAVELNIYEKINSTVCILPIQLISINYPDFLTFDQKLIQREVRAPTASYL